MLEQKLITQLQLKCVVIKKYTPGYSLSDHKNRKTRAQAEPAKKNRFWSTDNTELPSRKGWTYLSASMDS